MSRCQLTYEGKAYQFQTFSEAQEFLDKLPSGAEVQMGDAPLLLQLLNAPGAPLTNWREIIEEINSEFGRAITTDHRVALLQVFKSAMDIAETTIASEGLEKFREARHKHYKSFIVQEALVGKHVCVETLDAITQREIAAGRMAPDDSLRQIAEEGMAAPHQSRAELITLTNAPPVSGWRRALAWLRRG